MNDLKKALMRTVDSLEFFGVWIPKGWLGPVIVYKIPLHI